MYRFTSKFQSLMLETIKENIFKKYKKEDQHWLFFSLFDKDGNLLSSTGVLETDKPLWELIDIIHAGLLDKEKGAVSVAVDVVTTVTQESDMAKLLALPTKDYGIFLINNELQKSGVILPNIKWVSDIKTALGLIKQKYEVSGNVMIYVFQTERFGFNI